MRDLPAALARGKHLVPSRTQQLSPSAPMVLGRGRPGRVGRCRRFHAGTPRVRSGCEAFSASGWGGRGERRRGLAGERRGHARGPGRTPSRGGRGGRATESRAFKADAPADAPHARPVANANGGGGVAGVAVSLMAACLGGGHADGRRSARPPCADANRAGFAVLPTAACLSGGHADGRRFARPPRHRCQRGQVCGVCCRWVCMAGGHARGGGVHASVGADVR